MRSLTTFFTAEFTGALCRDQKSSSLKCPENVPIDHDGK